jgi:NADPH:quinone reductase-like Zn-dependent oxidoreductase
MHARARHFQVRPSCAVKLMRRITRPRQSGTIKPIVAKTFPLAEAVEAVRYLVEGRAFGRVVLTI